MADLRDSSNSILELPISDDLANTQDEVHIQLSQEPDYEVSDYGFGGTIATTFDPPMLFRHRHRFLDRVYDSNPDPEKLSAKNLDSISRQAGLCMEEVLLWFENEKSRRAKLLARSQSWHNGPYPPLSPHSVTSPGTNSTVTLTMTPSDSTSTSDLMQLQDILSAFTPSDCSPGRLAPLPVRRGRPPKAQSTTSCDTPSSPDSKRQKLSHEYPCPDCGRSFAAERWSEHVKRVHFPSEVWECPKPNERNGRPCASTTSKPFFRPDNFATHLKGEHNCDFSEISQFKVSCKFALVGFFHQICGICGASLKHRDISIEHIKEHFRDISLMSHPPVDLGASEWKERCGSSHILQRGVHYQLNNDSEWKSNGIERDYSDEANWDRHPIGDWGDQTSHSSNRNGNSGDSSVTLEHNHSSQYLPPLLSASSEIGNIVQADDHHFSPHLPSSKSAASPEETLYPMVSRDPESNVRWQPIDPSVVDPSVVTSHEGDFTLYPTSSQSHGNVHGPEWFGIPSNGVDAWVWPHTDTSPVDSPSIGYSLSVITDDSTQGFAEPPISEVLYTTAAPTPIYPFLRSTQYSRSPRRLTLSSHQSDLISESTFSTDENKEKGRCTYRGCGKIFKDLKAHMLTHSNERPEKCPIMTCDYHIKGFARKYDKNRHTLTHYKGKMICGFCPGSGTTSERSFNRADVFKRHLTSAHGVDQMPLHRRNNKLQEDSTEEPNAAAKKLPDHAPDISGKCSTCSVAFGSAQDFYEHLDDCVLKVVCPEEQPREVINAIYSGEIE